MSISLPLTQSTQQSCWRPRLFVQTSLTSRPTNVARGPNITMPASQAIRKKKDVYPCTMVDFVSERRRQESRKCINVGENATRRSKRCAWSEREQNDVTELLVSTVAARRSISVSQRKYRISQQKQPVSRTPPIMRRKSTTKSGGRNAVYWSNVRYHGNRRRNF